MNAQLSITPQQFYSELLYYARSKGIKDGWAYHQVRKKFGVFPRGLVAKAKETSPQTIKWIKRSMILYRAGKEKMRRVAP